MLSNPSRTRFKGSWVASAALLLAAATLLLAVGSTTAWALDWISHRQMEFPLVFCLGGSVLTGTIAAIGWMHSQRRGDGGVDPVGIRLSLSAGLLSIVILAGVTMGLDRLDSEHAVRTEVSPAETLAQ